MRPARLGRRELVVRAALAAVGGWTLASAGDAAAQDSADLAAVLAAIALQQALAVAYDAMARRPRVGRDLRDLLGHLAAGERQHAAALLSLAEFFGAKPQPEPTLVEVEAGLPKVRLVVDRPTALAVVDELERAELLGFTADVKILGDAKLIQMAAAVGAGDAQHLALVRAADGRDPIPGAFETGIAR